MRHELLLNGSAPGMTGDGGRRESVGFDNSEGKENNSRGYHSLDGPGRHEYEVVERGVRGEP